MVSRDRACGASRPNENGRRHWHSTDAPTTCCERRVDMFAPQNLRIARWTGQHDVLHDVLFSDREARYWQP